MNREDTPTVLQADEYARLNGLSTDCQISIIPLLAHVQGQGVSSCPPSDVDDLDCQTSLPPTVASRLTHRREQLSVSKESMELLANITDLGRGNDQPSEVSTSRDFAKLKLEPPLLREYDWRGLARRVQERRRADIDLTSIPSEPLQTANDESLEFPNTSYLYKQELVTAVRDERLDVVREDLQYLISALRDEWTMDKQAELSFRAPVITPPLSPAPEEEGYFIPGMEVCQVPLSSDPSTLLDGDLNKAEAPLLQQDDCQIAMSSSPLRVETPLGELPLLELKKSSLESLKIESPLSPRASTPPSPDLAVDISAIMAGMHIDKDVNEGHFSSLGPGSDENFAGLFSDDALATLKEQAALVKMGVEQEQLQAADAIARIEIPKMDFSIPEPGWQQVPPDAATQLAWIEKTYGALDLSMWPKNSNEERGLRWSPFDSKAARIHINESIDGGDDAEALLVDSGCSEVLSSADFVWKQPGLAILRDVDEDDEEGQIELPIPNEDSDLRSLVRKRKYELANLDLERGSASGSASPIELVEFPAKAASTSYQTSRSDQGERPRLLLDYNDPSAASRLLSNYVDFHTSKRQKHTKSSFFPTPAKPATQTDVAAPRGLAATTARQETAATHGIDLEQDLPTPAPCPILQPTSGPTKIIKALTLSRGVFALLEKLYPDAEIIERDFDRWNTLAWDRNSVSRTPVASPLAAEADVIVSPATGIVVTTLLRALQKPLPGDKGQSAIRERIRSVAARYERLVVLVSEANRDDDAARELAPSECAGYADFAGFVAGLDASAQTYYVGGGDGALARWLVSLAIRHAPEAANVQSILIQDETLWELFLRRAGVNAYAAQAILGQLKAPDGASEEEAGRYGLPAFVRMSPLERLQNFGRLMGGERVLHRVNEVLEARWG
ncbi:hypothetical protein GGR52DRAFT_590131 [Hypoxylon sp. FL1284]|nr:hypothetical protein GGR52DRAFT_590131 [Hypoxylon sp. FL1284]